MRVPVCASLWRAARRSSRPRSWSSSRRCPAATRTARRPSSPRSARRTRAAARTAGRSGATPVLVLLRSSSTCTSIVLQFGTERLCSHFCYLQTRASSSWDFGITAKVWATSISISSPTESGVMWLYAILFTYCFTSPVLLHLSFFHLV